MENPAINMEAPTTGIYALPNELLIPVLMPFPTCSLLALTTVSHRFHDLILRILHHRLIHAASLPDHKLVLECFHPSNKLSAPYLLCDYLGTDGLSDDTEGEGSLYKDVKRTGRLGKLGGLYSHFRPVLPEENRLKVRRPHPAGDVPGHPNTSTWFPGPSQQAPTFLNQDLVSIDVHLESHELFSQLCTITNLVKIGPKRGLFLSCVDIGDETVRIFRDWLAERAKNNGKHISSKEPLHDLKKLDIQADDKSSASTIVQDDIEVEEHNKRMLWVDKYKNVGLRLRVVEKTDTANPILLRRDEDAPVSYVLQYEELVIRTTHLLLNVEKSLFQEKQHSGKAIVFGSFFDS